MRTTAPPRQRHTSTECVDAVVPSGQPRTVKNAHNNPKRAAKWAHTAVDARCKFSTKKAVADNTVVMTAVAMVRSPHKPARDKGHRRV